MELKDHIRTIPGFPKPDIVFVDIDKWEYPRAFDLALPRVRRGGLLIADNALWSGRILEPDPDEHTRGILEFNRKATSHPDLETVILPVRDGVAVSRKI